jgi:hypothetical protein
MLTIHASLIKCAEKLDRLIPKPFSDGYESSSSFTSNHVHLPISQSRNEVFVPEPDQAQVHKLAKELRQLVLLFDDLLIQEYSPGHLSMEYQDHADDNITCDACTCDIFVSFFECRNCDATSALTLCPSCYIDGRTCRCGSMIPVQCRRFDDLISDRKRVAQVLTRVLNKKHGRDLYCVGPVERFAASKLYAI